MWKDTMQTRSRRGAIAFLAAAAFAVSTVAFAAPSQATDQTILNFEAADGHVKYGAAWNFGGIIGGEITAGPTGGGQSIKFSTNDAPACWAGTTFYMNAGIKLITPADRTVSFRFYTPNADKPILIKLENMDNGGISVEQSVTSVAGWNNYQVTLPDPGANVLNKASIFPDFTCGGGATAASTDFYLDSVSFPAVVNPAYVTRTGTPKVLTFEDDDVLSALTVGNNDLADATGTFGGTVSSIENAPANGVGGKALKVAKHAGAQCWAGVGLMDARSTTWKITDTGKPVITMNFYSPINANIPVMLKLEAPIAHELTVQAHQGWQVLTFDYSTMDTWAGADDYKLLTLFPNFCGSSSADADANDFYIDNVAINGAVTPVPADAAMALSPKIGRATIGREITATPRGISGAPAPLVTYQWYMCTKSSNLNPSKAPKDCTKLTNKVSQSIMVTKAMKGKYLRVMVRASNYRKAVQKMSATSNLVK
jgi:hypothetical protein